MSYSFTEKKRIRKSFASRPSVLEVPSLLDTQLRSYEEFLQADVAPNKRNTEYGLQAAFTFVNRIGQHGKQIQYCHKKSGNDHSVRMMSVKIKQVI